MGKTTVQAIVTAAAVAAGTLTMGLVAQPATSETIGGDPVAYLAQDEQQGQPSEASDVDEGAGKGKGKGKGKSEGKGKGKGKGKGSEGKPTAGDNEPDLSAEPDARNDEPTDSSTAPTARDDETDSSAKPDARRDGGGESANGSTSSAS
ncbi:hypothetical protein [Nocardia gamkensis]|uniref:Uncharacterized protein n=1 Tax=Nocardia gamkensis TaxID=352869 RepID=A0A7X6R509_9NOCA|nr:hypothetical protein [Nocardia gamkensis]NKY29049.1 hypothetical protein [Nocardia gamkensis]NQE66241.1 hypothetical protein [Nocardia gamkensis]